MLLFLTVAILCVVFGMLVQIFWADFKKFAMSLYLLMAIFWLVVGVVAQFFWETLEQHAYIPVSRYVFGFIFFVLFSFNFLRWRMSRMVRQPLDDLTPAPKPRVVHREYDPTFDFSDDRDAKPPRP